MTALRQLLAIVGRELRAQRLAFLAAAAFAALVLAAPFLPWAPNVPADDLRRGIALALALPGVAVYAVVLGATLVASDLAERRLAFYLARPISPWTLWLGKLAAGTVLVVTTAAIVLLPGWAAGAPALELPALLRPPTALTATLLVLALVLVVPGALAATHAVAVALRSRSSWLVADVVGLGMVLGLGVSAVRHLLHHQAEGALVEAARWLAILLPLAFVVTGGVSLARGRTEPERVHRWSSLLLWPALVAAALALGAFARWTVTPPAPRLERLELLEVAPRGDRVVVGGPLRERHYRAAFLVEPRSGEAVRLGELGAVRSSLTFSADGSTAAWMRVGEPGDEERPVFVLELGSGRYRRTRIALDPDARLALSADGRLLAAVGDEHWTVHAVDDGRTVAAMRRPAGTLQDLSFVSPHHVVLVTRVVVDAADGRRGERDQVWRLDVREPALRRTLDVAADRYEVWTSFVTGGLVASASADAIRLHDPVHGGIALRLPFERHPPAARSLRRLVDGRWVVAGVRGELRVFAPGGEVQRSIDFGRGWIVSVGPELSPGLVFITVADRSSRDLPRLSSALAGLGDDEPDRVFSVELVDLATGERRHVAAGMTLLRSATTGVGSPVLLRTHRRLLWWDPTRDVAHEVLRVPVPSWGLAWL